MLGTIATFVSEAEEEGEGEVASVRGVSRCCHGAFADTYVDHWSEYVSGRKAFITFNFIELTTYVN